MRCYAYCMSKNLLIGAALILLAGIAQLLFVGVPESTSVPEPATPEMTQKTPPTFSWSYREYENEGIPYTEISLTASYENRTTSTTQVIDRVEGSCNAYEDPEIPTYERSTMVICYYAGLGRYYRVVKDGEDYAVQRRVFEEASPDYEPPIRPYETILWF